MRGLLTFTKDLLFPRFCVGCGFLGAYICPSCEEKLPYARLDTCLYCQKASPLGLTHPICRRSRGVDGFMAIFFYNSLLKKIIGNVKYRLAKEVLDEVMKIIAPFAALRLYELAKLQNNLVICPVPLHRKRRKKRGFNQAELLADFISILLQSPKIHLLTRIKDTPSQTSFNNGLDRYRNMQGAFAPSDTESSAGRSVLLVDDVVTTGATVKSATRVLKTGGAKKVYVFSLAKG